MLHCNAGGADDVVLYCLSWYVILVSYRGNLRRLEPVMALLVFLLLQLLVRELSLPPLVLEAGKSWKAALKCLEELHLEGSVIFRGVPIPSLLLLRTWQCRSSIMRASEWLVCPIPIAATSWGLFWCMYWPLQYQNWFLWQEVLQWRPPARCSLFYGCRIELPRRIASERIDL